MTAAKITRKDGAQHMVRDDVHGRKRELEVVTIADLNVDLSYQRELRQNLVERILAKWDFLAADTLTVSRRKDGSLWCVNGQHRGAAAQLAGETEVLAWVYEGLSVKQEADLRLKANNSGSDTPMERFHGQIAAGFEESLAIQRLVEEVGSRVNRGNNSHLGVNCVSALEGIYRVDDGLLLRNTLRLVSEAFGEVNGETAKEPVLRGTAWFLRQHSTEVSHTELRAKLSRSGVDTIMLKARAHSTAMGGSMWVNYYRAMVETWNYRRTENNRIEWRTQHKGQIDHNQTRGEHRRITPLAGAGSS